MILFSTCLSVCMCVSTTATTTNVRIRVLPSHSCRGTLQNLQHLKLLHSSMQTSTDRQSGQRQVSHMTDEKGETWSPFGMSKVRSRPESLLADCYMPTLQPPERHGRQGWPDESKVPAVSWCQQSGDSDEQQFLMLAAGCPTDTLASAVPCHVSGPCMCVNKPESSPNDTSCSTCVSPYKWMKVFRQSLFVLLSQQNAGTCGRTHCDSSYYYYYYYYDNMW